MLGLLGLIQLDFPDFDPMPAPVAAGAEQHGFPAAALIFAHAESRGGAGGLGDGDGCSRAGTAAGGGSGDAGLRFMSSAALTIGDPA